MATTSSRCLEFCLHVSSHASSQASTRDLVVQFVLRKALCFDGANLPNMENSFVTYMTHFSFVKTCANRNDTVSASDISVQGRLRRLVIAHSRYYGNILHYILPTSLPVLACTVACWHIRRIQTVRLGKTSSTLVKMLEVALDRVMLIDAYFAK